MTAARRLTSIALAVGLAYWLFADLVRQQLDWNADTRPIRFSYWGDFEDHALWTEIVRDFEALHPGAPIQQEWLPLSGYQPKIEQQLTGGAGPAVMMFQDEPFPRFAHHHFLRIDPDDDAALATHLADCWPSAVASFQVDNDLRGIPLHGGNVLIFCNPDAFDRAAQHHGRDILLPTGDWTLEEFAELAQLLTIDIDGDGSTDQYGFFQPYWVYYLPFIWSHGADLLDESRTRWTLQGPQAEAAFAFFADLNVRHGVTPNPQAYAGQDSDTAFLSGRVAMCVTGPWFMPYLNQTDLRGRYRVVPFPNGARPGRTRVTWDGLCINANVSETAQARGLAFAKFVLTAGVQRRFAEAQRAIPACQSLTRAFVEAGGGSDSPAAAFADAMQTARMQPITEHWIGMSRAVGRHLGSTVRDGAGRRSPRDALEALANDPIITRAFEQDRD